MKRERGVANKGGGSLTRLQDLIGAAGEAESEGMRRNEDVVQERGMRNKLRDE